MNGVIGRELAVLKRVAYDDGARFRRLGGKADDYLERARQAFQRLPWPALFVFYTQEFNRGWVDSRPRPRNPMPKRLTETPLLEVKLRYQTANGAESTWRVLSFPGPGTVLLAAFRCHAEFSLKTGRCLEEIAMSWFLPFPELLKLQNANPHTKGARRRGKVA